MSLTNWMLKLTGGTNAENPPGRSSLATKIVKDELVFFYLAKVWRRGLLINILTCGQDLGVLHPPTSAAAL